jgi:hypothetical protein
VSIRGISGSFAAACVCLAASAVAEPADPEVGAWRIVSRTDTMTDELSVAAININTAVDINDPAVLTLFCYADMFAVGLQTRGYWAAPPPLATVVYRIDTRPAVRERWFIGPDGRMVHMNEPRPLIAALAIGSKARFRVETSSASHEAVFDLAGTAEVLPVMQQHCARKAAGESRPSSRPTSPAPRADPRRAIPPQSR